MTARRNAWITHAIVVSLIFFVVGTWAVLVSRSDHGNLHIGRALAIFGSGAAIVYALLATALVAAWGRGRGGVQVLHLASLLVVGMLLVGNCAR